MRASLRRGQGLMRVLNNLQILQINTERGNGMCKFCTYHFLLAIPFQWFRRNLLRRGYGGQEERKGRKEMENQRLLTPIIFPEKPSLLV